MRIPHPLPTLALLALLAAPAGAQLAVPGLGDTLGKATGAADGIVGQAVATAQTAARDLAAARLVRLAALARDHRDLIELDASSRPARRGELLLLGADPIAVARAAQDGFAVIDREGFADLGFTVVRLAVPAGLSLARAEKRLRKLLPDAAISADQLYFASGGAAAGPGGRPAMPGSAVTVPIGMIDGAPGAAVPVEAVRGFARGAPLASSHGSAVASLLRQAGASRVVAADVYGADPAGGNAMAIVRALSWLLAREAKVISISLVGPPNPVLAKAIGAAQARGAVIVAAVGNDGPAAPPSFPASYPGVLAVTGVDGRNRALIEAGRALHLDYAAPAAGMVAANAAGRWVEVRGTSFATPLVAARTARAMADRGGGWQAALDREAQDLGKKGPDKVYGRGLLCGECRRSK